MRGDPLSSELINWKSTTKPEPSSSSLGPSSSSPIPASNPKSDFEKMKKLIKNQFSASSTFLLFLEEKSKILVKTFSDGWKFLKTNLATWQNYVLFAITHSDVELKFTWPIRVQTSSKTVAVVLWSAFSPSTRTTWVQNLLASKLIGKDENKWNRGLGLPIFK